MVDGREREIVFEWAFILACCGESRMPVGGLVLYSSAMDEGMFKF